MLSFRVNRAVVRAAKTTFGEVTRSKGIHSLLIEAGLVYVRHAACAIAGPQEWVPDGICFIVETKSAAEFLRVVVHVQNSVDEMQKIILKCEK